MEKNNPKYRNQGIHVISAIFTIDKGVTRVLLIKRSNHPYNGMWALVGGALYNDEEVMTGMTREIFEKTGIDNVHIELFDVFSDINRSPVMRMVALAFLGIVDKDKFILLKETMKTSDAEWFAMDQIPDLAYDHNMILSKAYDVLKRRIRNSDLLKSLYPLGFTMPEIQLAYESILNVKYDRRNFRKKLLSSGLIEETNSFEKLFGNKPARIYKFKSDIDKNVF